VQTLELTDIQIPYPDTAELSLRITVGACRLKLRPGGADMWVNGTYADRLGRLPCRVTQDGGLATITQAPSIPDMFTAWDRVPEFDLAFGTARPFNLTIETGASEAMIDLGGVPLSALAFRVGAGKYTINFSAPNPQRMSRLRLEGGAAALELTRLANANCADMSIEGGAAGFILDFSGALQQDCHVKISTGLAGIDLRVPHTTAARVSAETVLGGLDIGDGFMKREGAFWTEAALAGQTPVLAIETSVAHGGLKLHSV
jgi:hypothetical protein